DSGRAAIHSVSTMSASSALAEFAGKMLASSRNRLIGISSVSVSRALAARGRRNGLYPGYYSGDRLRLVTSPVVPFGKPPGERADAVRNREHLLQVAREMIAELGVEKVTM